LQRPNKSPITVWRNHVAAEGVVRSPFRQNALEY
jgi:hypothetical protein